MHVHFFSKICMYITYYIYTYVYIYIDTYIYVCMYTYVYITFLYRFTYRYMYIDVYRICVLHLLGIPISKLQCRCRKPYVPLPQSCWRSFAAARGPVPAAIARNLGPADGMRQGLPPSILWLEHRGTLLEAFVFDFGGAGFCFGTMIINDNWQVVCMERRLHAAALANWGV